MDNTALKKRVYFENLDGLRFLCFLSIFFYHSFYTESLELKNNPIYIFVENGIFGNANIGVNFFFVLSGFLITYLLIQEKQNNGQINLKNFWIRRALRIWPLFYFCVFFGFVIFPYIKQTFGQTPNETADPLYYLTFLNNFDLINVGKVPDSSVLGILWSIAVEEQFYLIWPIIIFLFPLKKLWIPFTFFILTSLVYRTFNTSAFAREFHTLSCIGDMTVGAFGAWLIIVSEKFKKTIADLSKIKIAVIYVVFFIIYIYKYQLFINQDGRIFEKLVISLVIILIILEQCYAKNSFFKMSQFKRISQLGIITYGLYCLHFIGILITTTLTKKLGINAHLWQIFLVDTSISFVIALAFGKISYRFLEAPFLKLKERFSALPKV